MKHIKLFENFNDEVHYIINKVGNSYRIFALTPKMKSEGGEPEDAESLFGKGDMWSDYFTYDAAQKAIDILSNNEQEESEFTDY